VKTTSGTLLATVVLALGALLFSTSAVRSEDAPAAPASTGVSERIEVTATRLPESVDTVPVSIDIFTAQDLRDKGARDLRSAIALAAGVDISPGGDGGPASSVPEFWGLREFDAFLLVVDGVPWGGAFNPALATLDLSDVERIEVMRGAAPVMYGATSFVGVIQVIRRAPGDKYGHVSASGGSYGSGSVEGRYVLPDLGSLHSSFAAGVAREGYKDDRTEWERGHFLWRGGMAAGGGNIRLDFDATWMQQDPSSPVVRDGMELSSVIPLDANYNPQDAHINERRLFFAGGYDHPAFSGSDWSTTVSVTDSDSSILRGFLTDITPGADPNANAIREEIDTTDIYFDTHLAWANIGGGEHPKMRLVTGVDYLYGRGMARGGDFNYFVDLDGDDPDVSDIEDASHAHITDKRQFAGLYAHLEWFPWEAWRFEVGLRLNHTQEDRNATIEELETGETEGGEDSRSDTRGSGGAGVIWTPWIKGENAIHVFANYRNTFKPAAIDFGLEAEGDILEPETAESAEIGAKTRFCDGRVEFDVTAFRMDFSNQVVSTSEGGVPGLENAGDSRFQGVEADVEWQVLTRLWWRTTYALHDARFRDYVTEFDGVPTQLRGNRQEMSPRYMASTGFIYGPEHGFYGSAIADWIGERWLNKRNTALANDYITWSAGVGYRTEHWDLRADCANINDQRPPISESELGDAQYYLLPARHFTVTGRWIF
jgi:iron complex outermembrane receptor protein